MVQDERIQQINDHLRITDKRVEDQGVAINETAIAMATTQAQIIGMQNENRVWFTILGTLIGGSGAFTVVQIKRRKQEEASHGD